MQQWVEENGGWKVMLLLLFIVAAMIVSLCGCFIDFESEAWIEIWSSVPVAYADELEEKYWEMLAEPSFEKGGIDWLWIGIQNPFFCDGQHAITGECYAYLGDCTDCYEMIYQILNLRGYQEFVAVITFDLESEEEPGVGHNDVFSCRLWCPECTEPTVSQFTVRLSSAPTGGYRQEWFFDLGDMPYSKRLEFQCFMQNDGSKPTRVYVDDLSFRALEQWPHIYLPIVFR